MTTNYKIISEELLKQEVRKGLITNKSYNTIEPNVVGKWCIMIELNSGVLGVGIHTNKQTAEKLAYEEAKSL